MSQIRNPYGDELKSVVSGFGSDVSSQRLTPFEEEILQRAALLRQSCSYRPLALDLFSGYCAANALHFARLGFAAYAVDFSPPDAGLQPLLGRDITAGADSAGGGVLQFWHMDVRQLDLSLLPAGLDLITCQRGLHFLPFTEARALIVRLAQKLNAGASMYFSIGALDCLVGPGYKHADRPVTERWHPLEESLGEPIHVTAPLCLYGADDIVQLFADLGGAIVRQDQDDFGLFLVEFRKN